VTACPPCLFINDRENGDSDAFLLPYEMVLRATIHVMFSHLTDWLAAYFVLNINNPKHYQLLGLLQRELVHGHKIQFFRSVSYVNFMKRLRDIRGR